MAKPDTESAKSLDAVGWGFWLVTFAVLYAPAWFLSRRIVFASEREGLVPWVMAFTFAAIGAGLLSFAVNAVLRRRAETAKRQARHEKKKAGKK
jgi:hypothetical protein